jgi:pimeloyl-ACP methyl ester carboxylesterase
LQCYKPGKAFPQHCKFAILTQNLFLTAQGRKRHVMTMKNHLLLFFLAVGMAGCTYLGNAVKQANYSAQQGLSPTQRVYKHMLEAENFFVFGKIENGVALNKDAVAVVALSDLYKHNEVVDVSHFSRIHSYYGLNLPEGDYRLLVVSDLNRDGFYDGTEVVGGRSLSLDRKELPEKVLGGFDIDLNAPFRSCSEASFHVAVHKSGEQAESLFFPKGSIRSLDNEIFSRRMATLGMYEPAAFLEEAPMMFYALEEDVGYKVPVVFVHGIDGSARDFEEIVSRLDRTLYQPWFFYYPSGNALGQLSEMFYNIFLSGKVIPLQDMPIVIVAHSMGGLVVRDAMNRCTGRKGETKAKRLITIASPMAGHPEAKIGAKGPVAVPSWRDLAPESFFMRCLRRKTLPAGLEYHLIYAYGNPSVVRLGENSDGVVPLSSQLCPGAQEESTSQCGFNDSHTGILRNPDAVRRIIKIIEEVRPPFPEDHLKELLKGGYTIELGEGFSPMEKYLIRTIGHWMEALESGTIVPVHPAQAHFVQVCRGEKSPGNDAETAWLKFSKEYPDRSGLK